MDLESIAVRIYRGQHVEAVHAASVAVVDAEGRLTHSFGAPEQQVVLRSAAKPFQALPLVTSGAAGAFGFGPRELALASASHNGSDLHAAAVAEMLARSGIAPEALQCGTHLPMELRLKGAFPLRNEHRDPLRHNCSGKHAGFLALARRLDAPLSEYLDPEGPGQTLVRHALGAACELAPGALLPAVDGCSAPTYAFALTKLAVGFKNLALGAATDPELAAALARIRDAMQAEPLLVSGEGRFDYDLARSFPGNVVNKGGAEAILGLGFRDPAIGIAIKVHDGGERALPPVAVAVLQQLGLIDEMTRFPLLVRHERPHVSTHAGREVGEIRADVGLQKLERSS
ncbi:MAG TPA: asparaginase [Polyangiaceae bacterium]